MVQAASLGVLLASLCIKDERDDSVAAIKEDLDTLLKPYRDKMAAVERVITSKQAGAA